MSWRNKSGAPLSSSDWLEIHHEAKLTERITYLKGILSERKPSRIVDLGCGTGLWLELIQREVDPSCELIGIDFDCNALEQAKALARSWPNPCEFIKTDISNPACSLPQADIYLAINFLGYFESNLSILDKIRQAGQCKASLFVRQYDGDLLRFGPLAVNERLVIQNSLYAGVMRSSRFRHFPLDQLYQDIRSSSFSNQNIDFVNYHWQSPYTNQFEKYLKNTVIWTAENTSEIGSKILMDWTSKHIDAANPEPSYFLETYLHAELS